MFRIEAPYPRRHLTIILPSPDWGDSIVLSNTLNIQHALDGTSYTYIKSKANRKRLHWQFILSRNKILELKYFFEKYHSTQVRVVDHLNQSWIGYFQSNPFEAAHEGAAFNFPGKDVSNLVLEFEEA